MIKNPQQLADFENDLVSRTPVDLKQNFALANSLLDQARRLGILPGDNPLEGLEEEIRVIRILNAIRTPS